MLDANTCWLFVTVACRDPSAITARKSALLAPQSFVKTLQALNDVDRRYQQKTPIVDFVDDPINTFPNSPFTDVMQKRVTSNGGRVVRIMLKTRHSQVVENSLTDMQHSSYAAALKSFQNQSKRHIENIVSKNLIKDTFNDRFIRNIERWTRALKFIGAFS